VTLSDWELGLEQPRRSPADGTRFRATLQRPLSHCGALNTFPGFRAIEAFGCPECGEGVNVERSIQ
jgi:hypothetical protein